MKKILSFFVLTILLVPLSGHCMEIAEIEFENGIYINNNNITMTETEVSNLRSLAFSDEQIALMKNDEFVTNRDLHGEIETREIQYVKSTYFTSTNSLIRNVDIKPASQNYNIELLDAQSNEYVLHEYLTEEEYNNCEDNIPVYVSYASGYTVHETTMKKLVTDIISVTYNGSRHYRYRNDITYKSMPSTRSQDLFGIRIDSTVSVIPETAYAKLNYQVDETCSNTCSLQSDVYNYSNSAWKRSSTGYAVSMKLPENGVCALGDYIPGQGPETSGTKTISAINGYMYFTVQKLQSTIIQTLNAYGSYQHAKTTISLDSSLNFSIGLGGLGDVFVFSAAIKEKYDGMDGTHAYLNVNW